MTTPMSDEELAAWAIQVRQSAPMCVVGAHVFNRIMARIEALIAERDAAVAKVEKLTQLVDDLYQDRARL